MNIEIRGKFSRNRNWKTRYYWCIMGIVINLVQRIRLSTFFPVLLWGIKKQIATSFGLKIYFATSGKCFQ